MLRKTPILSRSALQSAVGTMADLAPFSYIWRRDRAVQDYPEAEFIVRRLRRQDEVYRTAHAALGPDQVKSIFYQQKDFEEPLLPAPKEALLTGALWIGGITDYSVTLQFPAGVTPPDPSQVEVRTFPTAWGWFGWSRDCIMNGPTISPDGRSWTYTAPEQTIDFAYNARVKAQTEMIAVFAGPLVPVPELSITGGSLSRWSEQPIRVEWGFDPDAKPYTGDYETDLAYCTEPEWNEADHTAIYHCLYSRIACHGADSKLTFITDRENNVGATVLLRDLENGPIYVKEVGLYICREEDRRHAADYITELKKCGKKTLRERVNEHKEVTDFEELFRHTRLWRCPEGTKLTAFPEAPAPVAKLQVPDPYWQSMYEHAVDQLRGHCMWGMLTNEVARATLAMEMAGLYPEADRVYDYFLASPGVKSEGDFSDPFGSLEWARSMRHDIGYAHEGTHSSSGRLLYSIMHRYFYTGDRAWLDARLPRLKRAASWIIREADTYMQGIPERARLHVAGLLPPSMLGDYALPACDWRWYYLDNAFAQMGLSAFAKALAMIGDADAAYYASKTEAYTKDLLAATARESLWAPVRRSDDGIARSFIPRIAYAGGLLHYGAETNIPQFALGINDLYQGALPLGEIGCVLDADDRRLIGTLNAMEEGGMKVSLDNLAHLDHPTADADTKRREEALRALKESGSTRVDDTPAEDRWFFSTYSNLPKISHNANLYLREDDIPNFLHFFFNHALMMVGTNGLLWEHHHPDVFVTCSDPDNGTAGWFVENFRNMLVMEDPEGEGEVLWLAKGTPRDWLAQGKEIAVENTQTFFGTLAYRIVSDVDNGKLTAAVSVPNRAPVPMLKLRLRHPGGARIRSVSVNGKAMPSCIDADGETVTLQNPCGELVICADY